MSQLLNTEFTTMLRTHPVLLLSSRKGRMNTLTPLVWYMPVSQDPPIISISLKPSTMSYHYIREAGDFILCVPDDSMIRAVHFCGLHSGRDTDKIHHLNMPTSRGKSVSPLYLPQCLANIECKVRDIVTVGDRPLITAEVITINVLDEYYENRWLGQANLIYYRGGACYRAGGQDYDMSDMMPGYIPWDSFI